MIILKNKTIHTSALIFLCLGLAHCGPKAEKAEDEAPQMTDLDGELRAELDPTLLNFDSIIGSLDLSSTYSDTPIQRLGPKVAIFDNGFDGLAYSLGRRLPPGIEVEPYPMSEPQETTHGTRIAELVYAIGSGSPSYHLERGGPQLSLYNTNGLTNLSFAVDAAIAAGVEMIVYAQTWEYGGNLDGSGFINQLFDKARAAGIVVVVAVGNYAKSSYQQQVEFIKGSANIQFKNQGRFLTFKVPSTQPGVKISLGWSDFRNTIAHRTELDLDLNLYNARNEKIASSAMIQDGADHGDEKGFSDHAREIITMDLDAGTYLLDVSSKDPKKFSSDHRFWIAINGHQIELDQPQATNTVFIPADNPRVISVGASDVGYTSFSIPGLGPTPLKPEIKTISKVIYNSGETYDGSSAATAIAAAKIAAIARMRGYIEEQSVLIKTLGR
jgi:hypothetical protein